MPGKRADYRVTKKTSIGHGGCATVYQAYHKPSNITVAFKESYADPYARRRMAREIVVQGSLAHAHVMPILDSDSTNKWFTMPLADGDLSSLHAAMTLRDQVRMIDEVAQGLDAAHQLGHVHRDVTPGNILQLSENGLSRFVVADWGLVRQPHGQTTAALTSESRFIGTQGFAAPEMYVDPHGARAPADVYSLGRVAAWIAMGTLPFMTEPLLPEGPWRSFVRRTTERNPLARVQTMTELRGLLAEVSEEAPTPRPEPIAEYGCMPQAERMTKIRSFASVRCGDEDDFTKLNYAAWFLDQAAQIEGDPEIQAQIALMRAHVDREGTALDEEMEQNNPRY